MDLRERSAAPKHDNGHGARHPWEVARARLVLDLLAPEPVGRVLDVGAGDAFVARCLIDVHPGAHVVAVDANYSDADLTQYQRDGVDTSRTMPDGTFDTALLLDVLEHVEDDDALLRAAVSRVRPGGRVLVTVPAWPGLFSRHDRAMQHVRRYLPVNARALIGRAGLVVERSGGAFFSLLAPRIAQRALERAGLAPAYRGIGDTRVRGTVARALDVVLGADVRASSALARRAIDVPGLSFFALCRKPA